MAETVTDEQTYQDKLRHELEKLDDRQLLIEIAVNMSMAATLIQQMQEHPMLKRILG